MILSSKIRFFFSFHFDQNKQIIIGHRFRSMLDFGFACLDVLYALPDDTGEYTCVATNPYGKATTSAKLACSGSKHIITESQLPQGVLVSDVKKLGDQPYWFVCFKYLILSHIFLVS